MFGNLFILIGLLLILAFVIYKWWLPAWRSSAIDAKVEELEEMEDKYETVEKAKKKHGNVKKKKRAIREFKKKK